MLRYLIALLFAGLPAIAVPQATTPRPPNIIVVLADDLGYGDLGCYGQKKFATPNIDRLAVEGLRFTQVYAGSTVCAPSRCVLMTGLHTGHAYVRGNKLNGGVPLRSGDLTIAEVLKRAHYATGAFGKWGLGVEGTSGHPNRKGFDQWFGYLDQTHAHSYYTDHLFKNEKRVAIAGHQYSHDLIVKAAFDFVRQHRAQSFFLYLSLTIPHASLEVPDDSLRKYLGTFPETPYPGDGYTKQDAPRAAFAAMIDRFDRSVGQLMALLRELDLDRNTIVFFTSDNGPHREGGGDPAFFNSSGPLRGIKRDLYEGGIRVPMIVRWPGRISSGAVSDQAWAFWDLLPTLADIAGLTPPAGIDGISMLPTFLGQTQRSHDYLYWEFFERGFQQAIRYGDWKAIKLAAGKPMVLYNLSHDLKEEHDVSADFPSIVVEIDKLLAGARTESPLWPRTEPPGK